MKLRIVNLSCIVTFWTSYGFAVFSVSNPQWITDKPTELINFGLFKTCLNGDDNCEKYYSSDSRIGGARACMIMSIIIGFFGWCCLAGLQRTIRSQNISSQNFKKVAKLMPVFMLVSAVLNCIGLGVWTAYFCDQPKGCALYYWNYNYYTGWISTGCMFLSFVCHTILAAYVIKM